MNWAIAMHPDTKRDIKQLDKDAARRVAIVIDRLANNPRRDHPLTGDLAGCHSVEAAHRYRIVYRLENYEIKVLVIAIGKRENLEVYRLARERLANLGIGEDEA